MKTLLEKLKENNMKPYHMPGHKRRGIAEGLPYDIDITEIEGFDNLHDMQGVIKDIADRGKQVYKSVASYPLVNGSTCGVIAGIYSLTRENENVLIARNCHKSVYNTVEVLKLNPTYIMPETQKLGIMGKITPESVEEALKDKNHGTVVITSPTYEGVISDVDAIYQVCKRYGAYLFVDAAHGAHFMEKPIMCDMCVMSLHKTLPALTQTALLNICSDRVDKVLVQHALSIFETSSPSYVLLASIDECLRYVQENKLDFDALERNLSYFYENTVILGNMEVFCFDDPTKIIIASSDGYLLADLLRKHNIEVEMASDYYVLAIVTCQDKLGDLQILLDALHKIDKILPPYNTPETLPINLPQKGDGTGEGEFCELDMCCGKISKEYIWAYPPGVPLVVPNEIIDKQIIEYLKSKKHLKSTKGKYPNIYVKKRL